MFTKILSLAITILPLTTAAVLRRQYVDPSIPKPGEQSCVRQWYGLGNDDWETDEKLCFTTWVGAIWDNGRGCPGILQALNEDYEVGILDWSCEKGWFPPLIPNGVNEDFTKLHFCALVHREEFLQHGEGNRVGRIVDAALERIYAGAVDEFNCGSLGNDDG